MVEICGSEMLVTELLLSRRTRVSKPQMECVPGPGAGRHFSLTVLLAVSARICSLKSQGSCSLFLILENLAVDFDAQTPSPVMDSKH